MPLPLAPPPEATQKVSEMQETEVKPPPGGRVVSEMLHPGVRGAGIGTVVGMAEGAPVVVGAGATTLVVGVGRGGGSVTLWATAGAVEADPEQPQTAGISRAAPSPTANRLGATCPLRPGSSCPIGLTDAKAYRPEPGESGTMSHHPAQPLAASPMQEPHQ